MDFKIWEETILTWINSLGLSYDVINFEHVRRNVVEEIITIVEGDSDKNIVNFINEIFPNFTIKDETLNDYKENDYLCLCTLILIYVCFSSKDEMDSIRRKMCCKLGMSTQEYLTDFFTNIQDQGDVFSFNEKIIMVEISKFTQRNSLRNSASGDGIPTPMKVFSTSLRCDSPLLEYLQTPNRKEEGKEKHTTYTHGNSDQLRKIKELTDQLVEEELQKASLQERVKWHEMKCSDYDMKLKSKIKELEELKNEWQEESLKNENEITRFQNTIENNIQEKKKLNEELNYFENYVTILEKELSSMTSEKNSLEEQVKASLVKVDEYEREVKRLSEINAELKIANGANEAELQDLKETLIFPYQSESFVEWSLNDSLNTTVTVTENLGIVTENLLKEKTMENLTLQETVAAIRLEKETLANEIVIVKSQLIEKENANSQLKELKNELVSKIDEFVKSCNELRNAKSNVAELSDEMNEINVLDGLESKQIRVIFDFSKEVTDSASQLSFEDNETARLTTITENLNELEGASIRSGSTMSYDEVKDSLVQYEIEELNQEIITAKKSLIMFLRASMKNFEVLKIKENIVEEMSKQHEHLESRITSLTELNKRLTKEILNSKNISEIESEYREKELDSLRLEVESLKKASKILKNKLVDLEKTNQILVSKKDECMSELALLREKNKSLNNDLQIRVISQLEQQDSCIGFIRNKKEAELELERAFKLKEDVEKRLLSLRKMITNHSHKNHLELLLCAAEQKCHLTSQNLLHATYTCLKWTAKNLERHCLLIGQGNNFLEDSAYRKTLQKEQEENKEELRNILDLLNGLTEDLDAIERKCHDLSDPQEGVPTANETFDVIDLDEKFIKEKISINREDFKPVMSTANAVMESKSAWVVSLPSKLVHEPESRSPSVKKEKSFHCKNWVLPLSPPNSLQKTVSNSKCEVTNSKSSQYSTVPDVQDSPTNKLDMRKSMSLTSFISATDTFSSSEIVPVQDTPQLNKDSSQKSALFKEVKKKEETSNAGSEFSQEIKIRLEKTINKLEKDVAEGTTENEKLKLQLADSEERRRQEKKTFDKRQEELKQSITNKYENQLEHLKSEMKALYNMELAKHKAEQLKLNFEVKEQNKVYKDHVDELRNQLWDLGEKFLREQKLKRNLERNLEELKKKLTRRSYSTELESRTSQDSDYVAKKDRILEENFLKRLGRSSFPTIPTEDEDEIFDNRCLEDVKAGICKVEGSEGRLTELQYKNPQCLPHPKSLYPAEIQFNNPKLFKENDLKYGSLNFGQESQSLTDSDHSLTRSLLPEKKGKRKDQTAYKKPGPPTPFKNIPSKNVGHLSTQSGDFHATSRKALRENNDQIDRKSTSGRIRSLFTVKGSKRDSMGHKDENAAPVGSRGRILKIFPSVKPFPERQF